MARPAYKSDPAPRVVSHGSVSRPTALPKWHPVTKVANAAPRRVKKDGTSANG